jgi:hypothetical protein
MGKIIHTIKSKWREPRSLLKIKILCGHLREIWQKICVKLLHSLWKSLKTPFTGDKFQICQHSHKIHKTENINCIFGIFMPCTTSYCLCDTLNGSMECMYICTCMYVYGTKDVSTHNV